MNKMMAVLIGATIIMALGLMVTTVFDRKVSNVESQGEKASLNAGCQNYRQEYIQGNMEEEDVPSSCEVDERWERKRTVAGGLSLID